MTDATQQHLSAAEAAKRLGVSVATIRRWNNEGQLQGWRTVGSHRRFSIEELDAFVARRSEKKT